MDTRTDDHSAHHAEVAHQRAGVDDPEFWGWHHTFGKGIRIAGWIVAISFMLMTIGNHHGRVEDVWMFMLAFIMIGVLVWDMARSGKRWRD